MANYCGWLGLPEKNSNSNANGKEAGKPKQNCHKKKEPFGLLFN